MEGPPLKVIAEELSFVAGERIISAFGSAKIEKEVVMFRCGLLCHQTDDVRVLFN